MDLKPGDELAVMAFICVSVALSALIHFGFNWIDRWLNRHGWKDKK